MTRSALSLGLLLLPLALLGSAPALAQARLPAAETPTLADVVIEAQASLDVDEGHLVVLMDQRVRLDRPGSLDLTDKALRLPLLVPAVGDLVLGHGTIPPNAQTFETQGEAGLTIVKSKGGAELRGVLTSDRPATVRVRYPLSYKSATLRLGWGNVPVRTWLTLVASAAPPVRLQLAWEPAGRVVRYEQGRERAIGGGPAQAIAPGQAVFLHVGDLPVTPQWPRRALLWTMGLLVLGVGATAWRRKVGAP